jgi:hypothetical protein
MIVKFNGYDLFGKEKWDEMCDKMEEDYEKARGVKPQYIEICAILHDNPKNVWLP